MSDFKEQIRKDCVTLLKLLDKKYGEKILNPEDNIIRSESFKYIFEVPSNVCIYPNTLECHEEGYLTDSYEHDVDVLFIRDVCDMLAYSEVQESTFAWEYHRDPLFSKDEIVQILNNSKYIKAVNKSEWTNEEDEIKGNQEMNSIFDCAFEKTDQSMLEFIQDEIAKVSTELGGVPSEYLSKAEPAKVNNQEEMKAYDVHFNVPGGTHYDTVIAKSKDHVKEIIKNMNPEAKINHISKKSLEDVYVRDLTAASFLRLIGR